MLTVVTITVTIGTMKPSQMVQATPRLREAMREQGITHAALGRPIGQDRTLITKVVNQSRDIRRDLAVLIAFRLGEPLEDLFTDEIACCPNCGWRQGVAA